MRVLEHVLLGMSLAALASGLPQAWRRRWAAVYAHVAAGAALLAATARLGAASVRLEVALAALAAGFAAAALLRALGAGAHQGSGPRHRARPTRTIDRLEEGPRR